MLFRSAFYGLGRRVAAMTPPTKRLTDQPPLVLVAVYGDRWIFRTYDDSKNILGDTLTISTGDIAQATRLSPFKFKK